MEKSYLIYQSNVQLIFPVRIMTRFRGRRAKLAVKMYHPTVNTREQSRRERVGESRE